MALQALKNRENSTKKTEKRYRKNAVIVRFSDDEYKKIIGYDGANRGGTKS